MADDELAAPPATAASESTSSGRLTLRQVALVVEVAGLPADADQRAHRVEEVGQHEAEDPEDGGGDAELAESAEVELPEQAEVGRGEDLVGDHGRAHAERLLVVGVVEDDREDRRSQDAEDDGAAPLARQHDDGDHQAEDRDCDRHADEVAEGDDGAAAGLHQSTVDEPDEQDEEADADDDGLLELERDGLEDCFSEAGEHEDRDGDTFEEDQAHRLREGEALPEHQAEGHDRVQAHAGRDGEGAVGDQAHEDGHHAGDETGGGKSRREGQTLAVEAQDARVHENDVGHDDERREPR